MKIDETYKGLQKICTGEWIFDGDICADDDIEICLNDYLIVFGVLKSEGNIIAKHGIKATFIEAGSGIKVDGSIMSQIGIKSGCCISASGAIETEGYICAGYNVVAGPYISANERIKAGGNLIAGYLIKAEENIEAGGYIEVHGHLKAGYSVTAGGRIKTDDIIAGCEIKSRSYIEADSCIFAGVSAFAVERDGFNGIECAELRHGKIVTGDLVIEKPEQEG